MAKIAKQSIANFLNNNSQPEPPEEPNSIVIKMISVYDIIPNPENKYDTEDIEELADAIEATDDITPLDVKPVENNKYMAISGHRRQKAVFLLIDQGRRESDKVPCIVKTYNDIDEERAAIVFKNSQRVKTEREREMEIEMARPHLEKQYKKEREQAKAEGKEFPKFRKYFADKLGVSETTVHREVAYKKIAEEIKEEVQAGNTTKTAVAEIASLPHEQQKKIYDAAKDDEGRVSVKAIQEQKENLKKLEDEGQTAIKDFTEEPESAVNAYGVYKEKFIKNIILEIPKKYGEITIHIAHDPKDDKYRTSYHYQFKNSGGGGAPHEDCRPFSSEQEALANMIDKLHTIGSEEIKAALKAGGYTKDKPKTEVRDIKFIVPTPPTEQPEQPDEYQQAAEKVFTDLLQKEIDIAESDIKKSTDREEKQYISAYLQLLIKHRDKP